MGENEMLYCLIAFILGWLVARQMGNGIVRNGFRVGGTVPYCDGRIAVSDCESYNVLDGTCKGFYEMTEQKYCFPKSHEFSGETCEKTGPGPGQGQNAMCNPGDCCGREAVAKCSNISASECNNKYQSDNNILCNWVDNPIYGGGQCVDGYYNHDVGQGLVGKLVTGDGKYSTTCDCCDCPAGKRCEKCSYL